MISFDEFFRIITNWKEACYSSNYKKRMSARIALLLIAIVTLAPIGYSVIDKVKAFWQSYNKNIYELAYSELSALDKANKEIEELTANSLNSYYAKSEINEIIRNEYGKYFSPEIKINYSHCCKLKYDDSSTLNSIEEQIRNRKEYLTPRVFIPSGPIKVEYFYGPSGLRVPQFTPERWIIEISCDEMQTGPWSARMIIYLVDGLKGRTNSIPSVQSIYLSGLNDETKHLEKYDFELIDRIFIEHGIVSDDKKSILPHCRKVWDIIKNMTLADAKKSMLSMGLEIKYKSPSK